MMMDSKSMQCLFLHSIFILLYLTFLGFSLETDTLSSRLSLRDPDAIESRGRVFKLGFFAPRNTTNRYLGIFYSFSESTPVWIANRDRPLTGSGATVSVARDGNLVLRDGENRTVWSTNATPRNSTPTAQIQDTGNLILRDPVTGEIVWDSFSHPTDGFLPTMRITNNINTGRKTVFWSWRNSTDPGVGDFATTFEALTMPQIFTWLNGRPYWRSGPWNGQILIGDQDMYSPYISQFRVVSDGPGVSYFTIAPGKYLKRIRINYDGKLQLMLWNAQQRTWDVTSSVPRTKCDIYGTCGPFGSCNIQDSPICSCFRGFEPRDRAGWDSGNWTSGCVRRERLQCGDGDGFLKLQFMKVPDFAEQFPSRSMEVCRTRCSRNCSCVAFAYDPNIGCMFWSKRLIDTQRFPGNIGVDFYIRLATSELGHHRNRTLRIIIPVVVGSVAISLCFFIACWRVVVKRKGAKTKDKKISEARRRMLPPDSSAAILVKDETENINIEEMPLFTFEMVANATDQFSENNFLGRGGFGHVYKGSLNGKEVAVKRLSAASGQGMNEFMNEVIVISKVQHRNLVGLFGCCIENEEKIVIYEYMPNKSLDVCLFGQNSTQRTLDWRKRFNIIQGTGRGLHYLHKDSRLKIIHRDLKPSNVLLDEDWNPKISDFGMARIFGGNEDQGNTARIVGTYGYMAPEYAMEGRFSEKSDVYSFGVLMLEIISGKKNTHYYNQELSLSLFGYAWKLWSENNGLAFANETIASQELEREIMRCIHIALLCIQEFPGDRPTIETILSMLSREMVDLPIPEQPLFAEKWNSSQVGTGSLQQISINQLTLSILDGR